MVGFDFTGAICCVLGFVEACLISCMPRSGGDYIFQSRILGGAIGYTDVFVAVIGTQALSGLSFPHSLQVTKWSLHSLLLQVPAHNWMVNAGEWMTQSNGLFVLGIVVVAWAGLVNLVGMKWYRRMQKGFFYIGFIA